MFFMPAAIVREAHEERIVSTLLTPATKSEALEAVTLTGPEAARFTKLSAKTLERHAEAGEPVGRIKIGRRVLFLKAALESWLNSKFTTSQTPSATH